MTNERGRGGDFPIGFGTDWEIEINRDGLSRLLGNSTGTKVILESTLSYDTLVQNFEDSETHATPHTRQVRRFALLLDMRDVQSDSNY